MNEIQTIWRGESRYPAGLLDLSDPPEQLWVLGTINENTFDDAVSFVGARAATSYGEHVTGELVGGLRNRTIVSGGAYGIDAAAHRRALAVGLPTVAFMAGGLNRFYPMGNSDLFERIIANGGALISEVPPGEGPTRYRFLLRNRLIAAVSAATVVVEAGWRSGSLNTAGHATRLGRPLGAVPGPITSVASAGTNRLINEGARVITSSADVDRLANQPSKTVPQGGAEKA